MEPLSLYEGITVCLNKKVVSQRKKAYQPRRANKKPHIHPHSPLSLITHQFKNLLLHSSITHIQPTPVLPTYKKHPLLLHPSMEFTSKFKDTEIPSQSPHTNNESGGVGVPITRSDPNSPYPTTFVTADTSSFKQVVQMLTGAADNHQSPPQQPTKTTLIPPIKKQGFKLYERRNYSALNNKSIISPLTQRFNTHTYQNASFSPRHKPEILSPSLLDFPSLTLSPVTPLTDDPFDKSSPSVGSGGPSEEEERAIAEKGFYLHPSPLSTPRESEPQLLPLFPLSSPRVSDP